MHAAQFGQFRSGSSPIVSSFTIRAKFEES